MFSTVDSCTLNCWTRWFPLSNQISYWNYQLPTVVPFRFLIFIILYVVHYFKFRFPRVLKSMPRDVWDILTVNRIATKDCSDSAPRLTRLNFKYIWYIDNRFMTKTEFLRGFFMPPKWYNMAFILVKKKTWYGAGIVWFYYSTLMMEYI